jgi:5-methyltetrahydrofolate--homocysteine methyltransferase
MEELQSLKQMIIDGDDDGAAAATTRLLEAGASARSILDQALLPAMDEVGIQMKNEIKFIPEVLLSARTMQDCLDIIKPQLDDSGTAVGTVIIGTVEGDMHDIGKNLVAMLLNGAGFEVINIGKGAAPGDFVAAAQEHNADIVAMSGLLTTTIPKMPQTIQALKDAGIREKVRVIVGGAPVSPEWAKEVGADAYAADATSGIERCRELLS